MPGAATPTRQGGNSYSRLKAALDFAAALVLLILLSPLIVLIALAIRLDSPGSPIYTQTRVGARGRKFTIYKFRTMKTGTPVLATEEMQRQGTLPLTRAGRFLRRTSLDELPQLINILIGEMSFVGPRPALPTQDDVNSMRREMGAFHLKPGVTGLAQVMGRDDLDNRAKVQYDARYCREVSLRLDLRIVLMTLGAVASARGNK